MTLPTAHRVEVCKVLSSNGNSRSHNSCSFMLLKLPNTIGLIVEVGCGALVYIAINLMMKNALMFEMIQKLKTKLLHIRFNLANFITAE